MTGRRLALITAVLLVGAALRFHGLGALSAVLVFDEAWYGLDAARLLDQPQLRPFFPDNFGREGLWVYLLAPSIALFGVQPFALKIVALFAGILTLPVMYRLAYEVLGKSGALWGMTALSVLYWHVHFSHLAFRVILFPLFAALALALLLRAYRLNKPRLWLWAGVWLGVSFYTYIAARVWIALALLMLLVWFVRQPAKRRGAFITALASFVVGLPLLLYFAVYPEAALARADAIAIDGLLDVLQNIRQWLDAWITRGDPHPIQNAPDAKPILDLPLALLLAVGVLLLPLVVRYRWLTVWTLLLLFLSLLPALLATGNPSFLRGFGMVVPIALLIGAGAAALQRLLSGAKGQISILLLLLFAWSALTSWLALDRAIVQLVDTLGVDQRIISAADWLDANTPKASTTYYTFHPHDQPTIMLMGERLQPRDVTSFNAATCFVQPESDVMLYYVVFAEINAETRDYLRPYVDLTLLYRNEAVQQGYLVYAGDIRPDAPDDPQRAIVDAAEACPPVPGSVVVRRVGG
jgi:4-amino-4-deoxy-L-arabinose transferase-like glycosyltransferase